MREPVVSKLALERRLGSVRPDISAYINGVPVAIEIQRSTLSVQTLAERTNEYTRKGIYVLWLLLWTPYLDGIRYRPRLWEQWLHALYSGQIYYWTKGLEVSPYFFSSFSTNKFNGRFGLRKKKERSRFCTPIRKKLLHLVRDFRPAVRAETTRPFSISEVKLFMN